VSLTISPDIIADPKGMFVQFMIEENHNYGDIGGLVSNGGPQGFARVRMGQTRLLPLELLKVLLPAEVRSPARLR
jgi:hypothetical protein